MAFPEYDQYSTDQLLEAYNKGPERVRVAVTGLDESSFLLSPRGPGTWSIQEITMHLADSEALAFFRIRKLLAEPGSALPGYEQMAWTRRLSHQGAGAEARTSAFRLFRELRILSGAQFSGNLGGDEYGLHPEYGRLSLRNLLELYADHSERHLDQILTIRQLLGTPVKLPLLLPERLY